MNIEELKRDPEVLLKQCDRYIARMYGQVPHDARPEWTARLVEIVLRSVLRVARSA